MKKVTKMKRKLVMLLGCVYVLSNVLMVTTPIYATEIPTEAASESETEAPTEGETEAPTEGSTEGATEAPTEEPTEAATEAPTETSTEAPTESPTEAGTTAPETTTGATEAPTVPTTAPETTTGATEATIAPTTAAAPVVAIPAITVDGDASEWGVGSLASADSGISEWKVAKSEDGTLLYLTFSGIATTEWDSAYIWKNLVITSANGTSYGCQIANLGSAWLTPGASVAFTSNASGTNAGMYTVECVLPIMEAGYIIEFAGVALSEAEIPVFVKAEEVEPVYNGIVIDGNYKDWDAVAKVEAACPPGVHDYDCLDATSVVFDGDYVYIYLKNGATGSAAGAGANSNGRYSITTDTGRQLVFQVSTDNGGSVTGIEGASVAYFGDEWEIAIPASALPLWSESISFGLYQQEPFVSGVMNLQGITGPGESGSSGTAGVFTGIVYDGHYGDWNAYPHTLIQYATAGTQTDVPDGEGALYLDGSILYGHVISSMDAHLALMGGEFAKAISICFNGEYDYNGDKSWNLYPKLVAVAPDGTIDWNPTTDGLAAGNYEFYFADVRGEYNTLTQTNISNLAEHEQFFGKITITVGEKVDECEFYIDLEQVAKFLSYYSKTEVEASDFKMIDAQFGLIGSEYLTIGGTSSGPIMGVAMCMAFSGIVLLKRRRNKVVE